MPQVLPYPCFSSVMVPEPYGGNVALIFFSSSYLREKGLAAASSPVGAGCRHIQTPHPINYGTDHAKVRCC